MSSRPVHDDAWLGRMQGSGDHDSGIADWLKEISGKGGLPPKRVAEYLGVSPALVRQWGTGASRPTPAHEQQLRRLRDWARLPPTERASAPADRPFASSKANGNALLQELPLFASASPDVRVTPEPLPPILERLRSGRCFGDSRGCERFFKEALATRDQKANVAAEPPTNGMSAGKNTYTYDAHTYHTKVPPQGIAELLAHYLPGGGVVLDPFAGSGMTGVAARVLGLDCILADLAPAACFIANRFTSSIDPALYEAGIEAVLEETRDIRKRLYTTICRECGEPTEIIYTVWSYRVACPLCRSAFVLWDHCRRYGRTVREHKILTEFPCPQCGSMLKKSRLERLDAVPVMLGYKCCGSRQQETTHPLSDADHHLIEALFDHPPLAQGWFPTTALPDGVNLRQPKKHGLDRVDKMYTPRNLAAASQIWKTIHRIEDQELAGFLAFTFTSLYRRITRMSEFRFWGGSGNTATFNVPFLFDETNVFLSFQRKARTIADHLRTTAQTYRGRCVVINQSATALADLPDGCVDVVFTDPPFGGNINYSEMNILWESWLGALTDPTEEAIVNRVQGKGLGEYESLMTASLRECERVLRDDGWLLLVFMNSSGAVWERLRASISNAGFDVVKVDGFDKQHGTFKQFVSDNTAGCDLVLHCRKAPAIPAGASQPSQTSMDAAIREFLRRQRLTLPVVEFLHVARADEVDYRKLYSNWLSERIGVGGAVADFAHFRRIAASELRHGAAESDRR